MGPDVSKNAYEWELGGGKKVARDAQRTISQGNSLGQAPEINFGIILRYLLLGLYRVLIALKFHFLRFAGVGKGKKSLPWIKIGLALLAVYILAKKEVQFSVNMRAPLAGVFGERSAGPDNAGVSDQLGVVQGVQYREPAARTRSVADLDETDVKTYIERFDEVAEAEMIKFGIPASINLALGIIESQAGRSEPAVARNNHFSLRLPDRPYESAWENWRDHSIMLKNRFPDLFEVGANYKKWAAGLARSGYAKERNLDRKLTDIIEKYQLYLLDDQSW